MDVAFDVRGVHTDSRGAPAHRVVRAQRVHGNLLEAFTREAELRHSLVLVHVSQVEQVVIATDRQCGIALRGHSVERVGLTRRTKRRAAHVRRADGDARVHPFGGLDGDIVRTCRTTPGQTAGRGRAGELAVLAPRADEHDAVNQPLVFRPALGAAGLRQRVGVVAVLTRQLQTVAVLIDGARLLVVGDSREVVGH